MTEENKSENNKSFLHAFKKFENPAMFVELSKKTFLRADEESGLVTDKTRIKAFFPLQDESVISELFDRSHSYSVRELKEIMSLASNNSTLTFRFPKKPNYPVLIEFQTFCVVLAPRVEDVEMEDEDYDD